MLGLAASAVFEAGQTYFAGHTPGVTDVLLGGLGALCGAWVTTRVHL
jgi:VanZ family protein